MPWPRVPPLEAKGVKPVLPLTNQPFGHRTVFFRDPDGNVVEIFAEIRRRALFGPCRRIAVR
jgi:uncharacterized glyoxalase superfamily protein PhnB